MWNGRWSKELDILYKSYEAMYGEEPDSNLDFNFDGVSYNDFVGMLKKSLLFGIPFPKIIKPEA